MFHPFVGTVYISVHLIATRVSAGLRSIESTPFCVHPVYSIFKQRRRPTEQHNHRIFQRHHAR